MSAPAEKLRDIADLAWHLGSGHGPLVTARLAYLMLTELWREDEQAAAGRSPQSAA